MAKDQPLSFLKFGNNKINEYVFDQMNKIDQSSDNNYLNDGRISGLYMHIDSDLDLND